jgi:hypothetical protein
MSLFTHATRLGSRVVAAALLLDPWRRQQRWMDDGNTKDTYLANKANFVHGLSMSWR